MRKPQVRYVFYAFALAAAFSSCVPHKKVASTKRELSTIDSQLVQHNKDLLSLDQQIKDKLARNEIDDTATFKIRNFINKTNNEIDSIVSQNTVIIGDAVVNKSDWDRLTNSLSASQRTSKTINNKVMLITDLVNRNTVIQIDQDVLFEPGQYTVTPGVASAIGKFFEPASKEIDLFIKKYPDFPLSLVITANGYADGTTISDGSSLYRELKARLKLSGREPDTKELNKELSRARAQEVIGLFKKYTTDRSGVGVRNILYIYEGKGEAFPNPKATDYRVDDKRRRIVLLFWSVFPD